MPCDDQSRLQGALNDLRNVSKGALLSYRSEYILVFRKLETLVKDPLISQGESLQSVELQRPFLTHSNYDDPSPTRPGVVDTFHPFDAQASSIFTVRSSFAATPNLTCGHETSSPSSIVRLVKALDDDSSQIKEFLLKLQFEAAGDGLKSTLEDPRTVDLQLETQRPSLEAKFREGLSLRSLAIEFNEWENRVYGWSSSRRYGHVKEYLECNTYRFTNKAMIRAGIQQGNKMLICDRELGNRAISVILCFKSRRLHAVKFDELATLVTVIKQKKWIEELLYQKADWFDDCQRKYNAWYEEILQERYSPALVGEHGRKRRRSDESASNTQSTAAEVESIASVLTQDDGLENTKHTKVSGSDLGGSISVQQVTSSTSFPLISPQSSKFQFDFASLQPANSIDVLEDPSYQNDFATLQPADSNDVLEEDFATTKPYPSDLSKDSEEISSNIASLSPPPPIPSCRSIQSHHSLSSLTPLQHLRHPVSPPIVSDVGCGSTNTYDLSEIAVNRDPLVDKFATSFESFTQQTNPSFAAYSEIARPPYSELYPVNRPTIHEKQILEAPNTLEIYPSLGQGTEPPLQPTHTEIWAPYLEKNPYDGYSTYNSFLPQSLATPTTLETTHGTDPITHTEIMAPYLEKSPYDGYSTYNSFLPQSLATTTTLETTPKTDSSTYNKVMTPHLEGKFKRRMSHTQLIHDT